MKKNKFFKAVNWNEMEDRVDKSAWSRLNDFIWEPERVPLKSDQKEFAALKPQVQDALLRTFGSLAYSSSLQMQTGIEEIKKDAVTPEEVGVLNALQYLESINNKAFSYLLEQLAGESRARQVFAWADDSPYLQQKISYFNAIYHEGAPLEKRAAHVILETGLYHSNFYGSLYLFGQKKLPRTAEIIKLVLRSTSFNGMYPGYKYRLALKRTSKREQKRMHRWVLNAIKKLVQNEKKLIQSIYQGTGWAEEAEHYMLYSVNKALLNLGYPTIYPYDADNINPVAEKGVIKSAVFEDFFYCANENALTRFKEIND